MPTWLTSGFSPAGLLVVLLQQIPGVIRALHPPHEDPFARNTGTLPVEILEKAFGVASLVLIVIVPLRVHVASGLGAVSVTAALVAIGAYYYFYIRYYRGTTGWPILRGMATCPPLAFALVAFSQGNWVAVVTSVIFGMVHVNLTRKNLKPRR